MRFIGNYSSGKMGFEIARELARRGAEVILVSGPVPLDTPSDIRRINVTSAREMYDETRKNFPDTDICVFAAAVADYAPDVCSDSKIKREEEDHPVIHLKRNPDIAASMGEIKTHQFTIGFALETDNELENARTKLTRKNLDLIVLNSLRDPEAGFMKDTNKITIIGKDGEVLKFEAKTKRDVAKDIVEAVVNGLGYKD